MAREQAERPAALASQSRTTCSATARSNPGARGSGASAGRYRSACSASSNGEGSCSSRAPSMPSRRRTKPRSSPVASVAEQRTALPIAIPERLAQHLADHHGRGAQPRAGLGALAPDDRLVGIGVEAALEREGQRAAVWRATSSHSSPPPSSCAASVESAPRRPLVAAIGQRREVGRAHARGATPGSRAQPRSAAPWRSMSTRSALGRVRAVALAGALDLAREPDQVGHADARAEPLGGDVLELVRLVEDDDVVLGQHADAAVGRDPQPEVGEVQRVVDEHDLGLAGERPRPLGVAGRLHRAACAATAVGPDRELRPEPGRRRELELGAIARLRAREPRPQPLERRRMVGVDQALLDVARGEPADVVAAALQHDGVDLAAERRLGERQVVVQQLRLQRARRGRDHDGASGASPPGSGRRGSCPPPCRPRRAALRRARTCSRPRPPSSAARPARENRAMRGRADCRPREIQSGTPERTVTFGPVVPRAAHLAARDRI